MQLGTTTAPNNAEFGGGLFNENTGATMMRSTIEGNQARNAGNGAGGGIFNANGADDELRQTTVSGNSSDGAGGGITNDGGTMTILTSTISGNQAIKGAPEVFGGGISNMPDTFGDTATLRMINDTLTGNRAGGGDNRGRRRGRGQRGTGQRHADQRDREPQPGRHQRHRRRHL